MGGETVRSPAGMQATASGPGTPAGAQLAASSHPPVPSADQVDVQVGATPPAADGDGATTSRPTRQQRADQADTVRTAVPPRGPDGASSARGD